MKHPDQAPLERLPADMKFGLSVPHPCNYLDGPTAQFLVAVPGGPKALDPHSEEAEEKVSVDIQPMDISSYSALVEMGFRRSGHHVYAPRCPDCEACRAVRIPVEQFKPDRSQRRCIKANADLELHIREAAFDEEHFELYCRYQAHRHSGDVMDNRDPERYRDFLVDGLGRCEFIEFRESAARGGRLLAVAITDVLDYGLSAVYTFFEPEERRRGLGSFAVLSQIEQCRLRGLPHLYLGYWIGDCPKMSYKRRFKPLEHLNNGRWEDLELYQEAELDLSLLDLDLGLD